MKLERVGLRVADYRKSFAFYHDVLGLRLKNSWQRADSWGALFFCGEALLEIIWFPGGEKNLDCSFIPARSKTDIFLTVSSVEPIYQRLQKFGDLEVVAPSDQPWGYRTCSVYDPDRLRIVFAQPL